MNKLEVEYNRTFMIMGVLALAYKLRGILSPY